MSDAVHYDAVPSGAPDPGSGISSPLMRGTGQVVAFTINLLLFLKFNTSFSLSKEL